jgi:hypothetical protein
MAVTRIPRTRADFVAALPGWTAARWAFVALAAALLPVMILASSDFGMTWDEKERRQYGFFVWQFLLGQRSRSAFQETGGHLYPGMFDTICAAFESWLDGRGVDAYVLRHAINATFGWIGIVYCGRLAGRLFGAWAGVLAMALLAASPRFFADSMNNPKDLPFAAMTVVALYYISTVSPTWPYVPATTALKIAVALALALNIRVGALLYLGYFGALVLVLVALDRCRDWRRLAATAAVLVAVVLTVLLLGTIFWPWAGGAPLVRPFRALFGAANYPWDGVILFAGGEYSSTSLPWFYAPWWFAISTPPVVLAGAALSLFVPQGGDAPRRIALWTIAVAPVTAAIVMGSTLYDGVRHLEFVYPILVVLATAGWWAVLQRRTAWVRQGATVALGVGLVSILVVDVRLHPNQGVYFNSLVGGPRGAFKRYEMDYWGNCVLQAVEWTAALGRSYGTAVTVSGNPWHVVQGDARRFREVSFTFPEQGRHYLHIRLARGPIIGLRELLAQESLHQVRTPDGAVLCTVIPGPAYHELTSRRSGAGARPRDGAGSQ